MDGASDESWKVKKHIATEQFEKLQEALERMNEFDSHMDSEVSRLKELAKRTNNFMPTVLGALREDNIQHGGSTKIKNLPISIMRTTSNMEEAQK
jgi:hypothetical protein